MTEPIEPEIRDATESDLETIEAIIDANDTPPPGAGPVPPGAHLPYLRHLLERGNVLVAEIDGSVVGFGATFDTGRQVHLADFFVVPGLLGRGVGGQLLGPLFGDRWPRTCFASDDPRAMRLYVRAGMTPLWPNLYLVGDARRLPDADGLTVSTATAAEVATIEAGWTGLDRSEDHRRFGDRKGARPFVVRAGERAVAVGHLRDRLRGEGRWLDRLASAPDSPADGAGQLVAALRHGADEDGQIGVCLLGPHPGLPILFDAGYRIADRDTYMASDPAIIDPARGVHGTGIP